MKPFVVFTIVILSASLAYSEKTHDWEQGVVVSQDISSYNAGAVAMPIGTTVASVPIVRRSNVVVVETAAVRYSWSEVGKNTVILPVHGTISFYRDGNFFVVLDAKNKKHKFSLIGMTALSAK
jgi:hypothetical protein